jgi:primosomal protein N' (replication factor Y)
MLVKAEKGAALQGAMAKWVGQLGPHKDLRVAVDIDPQSFF